MMEKSSPLSLSVFFPAFNEEANIAKTILSAVSVLEKTRLIWEVIVVNDGSKDQTSQIAHQLAQKNSHIKVIDQPNGGYGSALRAGFKAAKYDLVCYTDSDGQFDFSEIEKLLLASKTAKAVWGYRIKRDDPYYREIFAKVWQLSIFLLFGFTLKDLDCGFKLLHREALEKVLPLTSTRGAMINAELAIKLRQQQIAISQVGVHHYPRTGGKPTGNSLDVIVRSYWELLKMRFSKT